VLTSQDHDGGRARERRKGTGLNDNRATDGKKRTTYSPVAAQYCLLGCMQLVIVTDTASLQMEGLITSTKRLLLGLPFRTIKALPRASRPWRAQDSSDSKSSSCRARGSCSLLRHHDSFFLRELSAVGMEHCEHTIARARELGCSAHSTTMRTGSVSNATTP
jgi:hypothetical protein